MILTFAETEFYATEFTGSRAHLRDKWIQKNLARSVEIPLHGARFHRGMIVVDDSTIITERASHCTQFVVDSSSLWWNRYYCVSMRASEPPHDFALIEVGQMKYSSTDFFTSLNYPGEWFGTYLDRMQALVLQHREAVESGDTSRWVAEFGEWSPNRDYFWFGLLDQAIPVLERLVKSIPEASVSDESMEKLAWLSENTKVTPGWDVDPNATISFDPDAPDH